MGGIELMASERRRVVVIGFCAICLLVLISVLYLFQEGQAVSEDSELSPHMESSEAAVSPSIDEGDDIKMDTDTLSAADERHGSIRNGRSDDIYAPKPGDPFGKVQPVPATENPAVASVYKALQVATRDPRQLTVLSEPTPFDRVAYLKAPDVYTNVSEPARAFRPAQPVQGVPRLRRIGGATIRVQQGETIQLRARTEPFMPVTFTSVDMARFGNQLTSQTVAADQSGIATVDFIAATGTLYHTDIQAASPVASGLIRWVIDITPVVARFAPVDAQTQAQPAVQQGAVGE